MKVRLLRQVNDGSKTYYPGDEVIVSDDLARMYIEREWAEPVTVTPNSEKPALAGEQGRHKE